MHHRQLRARSYVVPMHRYINYASLNVDVLDVMNKRGDSLRDFHTAQRNSSEDNLFELWISLSDFVRNSSKRVTNFLRVHYQDSGWWILFWLVHAFPWRPRGIVLKEKNQEADVSVRASFLRRSRQLERCFTTHSSRALSKPMSLPAFSLSIHLCFKFSPRSARNSLSIDDSYLTAL